MSDPRSQLVRAGPVSALLQGAVLRRIRVGPHEVIRAVYAAVRDENWGTVEPTISRYNLEADSGSFRLRFTAEHRRDAIDFTWDGEYVGDASGRIVFRFDGACHTSFRKNRIGFCVLLPTELAGTTYVRHTPGGPIEERFPERISPRRDISDIQSLHYAAGPVDVELRFEGDLFDLEDQRNWTDASYKTFCTPLARPFPVQVVAGERIRQTVTFEPRVPPEVGGSVDVDGAPKVEVVERVVGSLPPIGLGAAFDATPLSQPAIERLQALRPSHLRVELDLRSPAWRDVLHVATADAAALGSALDIAVVTDADGSGINEVWAALRSSAARVVRFAPFAETLWVTTPPLVAAARVKGVTAAVGGGSRTDFAQLNMRQALIPFGELDFVTYAITPQVHTFDDMSVVETLAVQAATVESARALAGERPILVAPITLRPRFNPNATAPEPPPLPGAPPAQADPRQTTAFCAAWTVGSLRRLASAGASALTYFETTGACGVMDAAGAPYPVYDVLAAVVPLVGAEILDVRLSDPLALEALALRKADRLLVVVANLTPQQRRVEVALPSGASHSLDLGPYATAHFDGT